MKMLRILLLMLLMSIIAACGRAEAYPVSPTSVLARPTETLTPEPNADLEATSAAQSVSLGQTSFETLIPEVGFACATCHAVEGETVMVGPSLAGIAERAAERVEGMDAYEYIHNSILHPNDYVVEGFVENLMPQTYAEVFTEEEIDQIIQYLLSL